MSGHSPISFSVDEPRRRRTAVFRGVVHGAAVLAAYAALVADPAYDPTLHDLVDLTEMTVFDASEADVRALARLFDPVDIPGILSRLAIVAPTDEAYELALLYRSLRAEAPEITLVFASRDEAERWLDSPIPSRGP